MMLLYLLDFDPYFHIISCSVRALFYPRHTRKGNIFYIYEYKAIDSYTPTIASYILLKFHITKIPLAEYCISEIFFVKKICILKNGFPRERVKGCGYGK